MKSPGFWLANLDTVLLKDWVNKKDKEHLPAQNNIAWTHFNQ